jgi:hypothetical protein
MHGWGTEGWEAEGWGTEEKNRLARPPTTVYPLRLLGGWTRMDADTGKGESERVPKEGPGEGPK